jgi:hypothetical protein
MGAGADIPCPPTPPLEGSGRKGAESGHERTYRVAVLGERALVSVRGPRDARIARVGERQRGQIGRSQLRAIGISGSAVARLIARGYLHRRHSGVYSVGHRAPVPLASETAALLACRGAVLSHLSAGSLWGLMRGDAPAPVHVLVAGRQTARPAGVCVHRTHGLPARDVRMRERLPVTSPARRPGRAACGRGR